jgi:hypothetical protein
MTFLTGGGEGEAIPDFIEHLVPPGAGPPFYLHRTRTEAIYVIQGRFRFRCGANDTPANAGQFLLMPKGLPHLYENVGNTWGRLLLVIIPGGLEPFHRELGEASRDHALGFERLVAITSNYGIAILGSHWAAGNDCEPVGDDCRH